MAAFPNTGACFRPCPPAMLLLSGFPRSRPGVYARVYCRGLEDPDKMSGKLRNRISIAASYFRHKTVLTGGPIEITLESTAKCNLYCPMCPRHIYTFDNENMDLELYKKIIQDCKEYVEFIWPYGIGEPMIQDRKSTRLNPVTDVSTPFPYTTLFRSPQDRPHRRADRDYAREHGKVQPLLPDVSAAYLHFRQRKHGPGAVQEDHPGLQRVCRIHLALRHRRADDPRSEEHTSESSHRCIYPLSLHDALPISTRPSSPAGRSRLRSRARQSATSIARCVRGISTLSTTKTWTWSCTRRSSRIAKSMSNSSGPTASASR